MDGMQSDPTVEASNTAEACTFTAHILREGVEVR